MKYLYLIIMSVLFVSCQNDDDSSEIPSEQENVYLKEITKNGITFRKYTYENGKSSEIHYFNGTGELVNKDIFSYSGDSIFVSLVNAQNQILLRRKYYNLDNTTKRQDKYDENDILYEYLIYNYDSQGCGTASITTYDSDNEVKRTYVAEYIDTNCSAEIQIVYVQQGFVYSIQDIMDDKNNPTKNSTLRQFFNLQDRGNTISYAQVDADDNELIYGYTSVFEYNNDDYPISEVKSYQSYDAIDTFEYIYY